MSRHDGLTAFLSNDMFHHYPRDVLCIQQWLAEISLIFSEAIDHGSLNPHRVNGTRYCQQDLRSKRGFPILTLFAHSEPCTNISTLAEGLPEKQER